MANACGQGNLEMAMLLINNRADINRVCAVSGSSFSLLAKAWLACSMLQPEIYVNVCCNARTEKNSIPVMHYIVTHVQIILYALPDATLHKQKYCEPET